MAKNGDEGTECREKILGLLSKFRDAQSQQDILIEKEKLRLDAFRNCINEDTTNRIKKRLTFFQKLNRQHEALLEHVRQDIQECRTICKKFNDSSGRRVASKKIKALPTKLKASIFTLNPTIIF